MIDEQDAIRPHVRIFVNGEQVWGLEAALRPSDEVQILQALSGG
jgi:sulfur-carrier protein